MNTRHGLSFDLEDWEQNVRQAVLKRHSLPSNALRDQVENILQLCDDLDVKATFFVVGRLAREAPEIVRLVADRGHEIGCHSCEHRLLGSLTRDELRRDTSDAKKLLEDVVGVPVRGYRAPEFSVGSTTHYCFEALAELGFDYDSSVYPVSGPRYGIPSAPKRPFIIATPAGDIVELPLLSARLAGVNLPVAGGTYYRMLPTRVLSAAVGRAEQDGGSAVLYFHPYEFSSRTLWLHGDGLANVRAMRYILLHNVATKSVAKRLRSVLKHFRFGPLIDLAAKARQATS